MREKAPLVRHSLDELPEGRIDRERVAAMTYAEIEALARADPDDALATDEELAQARVVMPSERRARGTS
jgi:hypothetical protein